MQTGWEPAELIEVDPRSSEPTCVELPTAACGRPYLTITAMDPHGGRPHVVLPDPTWEHHIDQLRSEVGGSSRLDATLALMDTHGNPKLAKAKLVDAKHPPKLEDVAKLLRSAIVLTTTSATFSCDKAAAAAEEYLQSWYEQLAFAIWETDPTGRSPCEADTPVEQKLPPQAGPRSFDPPGGPQDGPVHKAPGHAAYYRPPPASLWAVRGKLRHELEETALRYVPFQGGLYRKMTDEMEAAAATRAAMQWRSGGKASNGDVRWKPLLDDRKAAVLKAFGAISDGTATGKSVGEVAAETA